MRISGIYEITNNFNKKKYIGQSENCYGRWLKHKSDYIKNNSPLYNDMCKYGIENFSFRVIKRVLPYMLKSEQIACIDKYNTRQPNGYN